MGAGEVAAVIDIEHVGDATHGPGRIGLAPDRLAQREAGLESGRCSKEHHGAGDGTGIVVHHGRQPGPDGLARLIKGEQVEQGVIGLPDRIGGRGAVAMDQLVAVAEGGCPLMRQRHHGGIERGEDRIDRAVGRNTPALCLGDFAYAPVNGGG